jgi:hypothetical protein
VARKRISKRVREEAALLCAIAASTNDVSLSDAAFFRASGFDRAWQVALDAKIFVCRNSSLDSSEDYELACAEAEALLRCGWIPGDGEL